MSLLGANASLASVSGGGGAHVTALHFISAAGAHARGRRLSPHKPRRRLKISGWEMSGNLYTLGYFSAQICIGSPQRSFDLIVDTGSALTALPCDGCPHCGTHKHGGQNGMRFSESSSSSAEAVACSRPPPGMSRCRSCDASKCGYSVSYTEGSSIKGHLVYDTVWLADSKGERAREREMAPPLAPPSAPPLAPPSAPPSPHPSPPPSPHPIPPPPLLLLLPPPPGSRAGVRASFGCQTYESGLFFSQVADGITGFSQASTYGPTLFDYLQRGMHTPDVFSMCLSEEVGAMVLGGAVPPTLRADWMPYTGSSSYAVGMIDITIGGVSVGAPAANYRSTIVDSGTTFMYLPPAAYRKVRDHFRSKCPWGECASRVAKGEYPDDYCYKMDTRELDQVFVFAHPPISPICRTLLFPYLTFYSCFADDADGAQVWERRHP